MYERKEVTMPNVKNYPSDDASRKFIVENTNTNYFVEASAGSGKTYSLVLRMVAMIEGDEARGIAPVPVDQICTITFTKAAAAEFFSRFQRALSLRSVDKQFDIDKHFGPKTPVTMARCREALANIDLCFLGTIDAFCNMIAHELPIELGIPSDAEIISSDDRKELIEKAYENILKDPNNTHHQKALIFEDLFYDSRKQFADAINYLGNLRNADIPYDHNLVNVDINTYFSQIEKDQFLKYVEGLCKNDIAYYPKDNGERNDKYKNQVTLKTLVRKIHKNDWSKDISTIDFALKQIDKMEGFAIDVLNSGLTSYNLFTTPEKLKSNSSIKYSQTARECFDNLRNKIDNYKFTILMDLAISMIHDMFDGFKDEGKLDFFDYLYYLTGALRKDAMGDRRIINHILKRHSRLLLDESQDTNPMQTELFFYLTGTNKNAKNWTESEPKEGSLFIVGDPKQSIYGFRNANVQAFNKVKDLFDKKDQVLILTKNFRSKEILKEWFNASMNDVLNHGVEALSHPDIPIDQQKKAQQAASFDFNGQRKELYQGVYKYTVKVSEDPEAVARFIIDMVNNPNKIILAKNKKTDKEERKMIDFGDIRVVPRKTDVKEYTKAFNDYHIPVIIEADIPFNKSQTLLATIDLACLLKAPGDKASLFKVLYGDLFKLDDLDIIQMKADGFGFDISVVTNEDKPITFTKSKHQEIVGLLNDLYEKTKGFSFSSLMLYLLNNQELNLFDKISTDFLEYTFYLIEKVKEREETGLIAGIEQFKEYVTAFINGDTDDNRTIRFKDDSNKVILANLHKVKGLQAPIVILCAPNKGGNRSLQHVNYDNDIPRADIAGIKGEFAPFAERHDIDPQEQKMWDEYEKAEKERVEYVGATRAESVLIVANKPAPAKPSKSEYPDYNPWEDLIRNIPDSQSITVPEASPATQEESSASLSDTIKFDEFNKNPILFISPSKKAGDIKQIKEDNNLDEIKEVDSEKETSSTIIGTMIHRLMECLVSSREHPYKDLNKVVEQIVNEYHAYEYRDVVLEVANKIISGGYPQKNSIIDQDILSTLLKADEVYCETPFSYRKGNEIISGIIDLIYKDKNGYHIIDYKTNKCDDVQKLETEEYKNQLKDYVDALQEMGEIADVHIYHIKYQRP